jgi:CheY-like chemotaxis protein
MGKPAATDVYALTSRGNAQLKSAGTGLSARELELLVLVDGEATVEQIAKSAGGSADEVGKVLQQLIDKELVVPASEPSAFETGFFAIKVPPGFFKGKPGAQAEAQQGVASLKTKGYFVRIARRAEKRGERKQGWRPAILVVDDDPDIVKLLATYLGFEGMAVRSAAGRAEIMATLREPPLPDLILLDVMLRDANGFDVLARMRQHPVLKSMPIIMITAEATRGAVLKGLQAGADGYITKPFEPDAVVTAVKEVLGATDFGGPGNWEKPQR